MAKEKTLKIDKQTLIIISVVSLILVGFLVWNNNNKREIELGVKKGVFKIDGVDDTISFEIKSEYLFSEPGQEVQYKKVKVFTKEVGDTYDITLTIDYLGRYDIRYNGQNEIKEMNKNSIPYKVFISNQGEIGGNKVINFESN